MTVEKARNADAKAGYMVAALVFAVAILFGLFVLPKLGKRASLFSSQAPDFALPVINGQFVRPTLRLSDLDGQVVIVDFWASWCWPCRQQAPIVERVATSFKARGVTLVGIATSDQRRSAEYYAKVNPSSFPALYDENEQAARAYDVSGLPTLAVIDKHGKLVARRSGVVSDRELTALVEQALENK